MLRVEGFELPRRRIGFKGFWKIVVVLFRFYKVVNRFISGYRVFKGVLEVIIVV